MVISMLFQHVFHFLVGGVSTTVKLEISEKNHDLQTDAATSGLLSFTES